MAHTHAYGACNSSPRNKMKQFKIKLITRSDDQWSNHESFKISSNLSLEEILVAYEEATKKLGFNWIQDVCCGDYDTRMPENIFVALREYKIIDGEEEYWESMKNLKPSLSYTIDGPEVFTQIYLDIVKFGNPNFEYEFVKDEGVKEIEIGGHGFYGYE